MLQTVWEQKYLLQELYIKNQLSFLFIFLLMKFNLILFYIFYFIYFTSTFCLFAQSGSIAPLFHCRYLQCHVTIKHSWFFILHSPLPPSPQPLPPPSPTQTDTHTVSQSVSHVVGVTQSCQPQLFSDRCFLMWKLTELFFNFKSTLFGKNRK